MNKMLTLTLDRQKIAVQLARQGWTMKELAAVSGVTRQSLCHGLNGERVLPKTVNKVAAAFGCDVEDIIKNETEGK